MGPRGRKKQTNLPIFGKMMMHFCTDINILIKKKYIRQRSHIIMDFQKLVIKKLYVLTHFKVSSKSRSNPHVSLHFNFLHISQGIIVESYRKI